MFRVGAHVMLGRGARVSSPYRYLKLNVTAATNSAGVEINEWEMASSAGGANLIQGKAATASSSSGPTFVASNVNDGNLGNGWESATGKPQWVKIDMGAGNGFRPLEVRLWNNNAETPTDLELLGSNDDVSYTSITAWTGVTWVGSSPSTITLTITVAPPPTFSVNPTITTDTGFYGTGDTATVSYTNNGTSTTIQWTQDGANIGGATSASYTYVSGDVGHTVTAVVTAVSSAGSATAAAPGHAIVTPTFANPNRVTSSTATRVTGSGATRVTTERTA